MIKRSIFLLLSLTLLFSQDLSFTNFRWRNSEIGEKYQISLNYGYNILSHLFFEKKLDINDHIAFGVGAVLSSENDVGATFERPDFPLFSTGRFYRGEMILDFDKFTASIGRHVYDQDPLVQNSVWNDARLTGDGINWEWNFTGNWSFENSIEFLPNVKDSLGQYFERILNHHAVTWYNKLLEFTVGELSIYTGINQGINWRQSNPFLPYAFHYADSYDRTTPGYHGDNENAIVYAGLKLNFAENIFYRTRLFVDDIQIDAEDREKKVDGFLWYNEIYYGIKNNFKSVLHFSLSNPALGWHSGPYTDFITYGFELLPHDFGEIYSYGLKLNYKYKFFETYAKYSRTYKAVIDPYMNNLHLKSVQNDLEKVVENTFDIKCGFYILDNLVMWGHYNYTTENGSAYNLILQTYF